MRAIESERRREKCVRRREKGSEMVKVRYWKNDEEKKMEDKERYNAKKNIIF